MGTRIRRQPAPPGRIHARGQPPGEQNKCHHHQADQRADHQAQYEYEMIFTEPELIQPATEFESERGQRTLPLLNYDRRPVAKSRRTGRRRQQAKHHGVIIPLRTA